MQGSREIVIHRMVWFYPQDLKAFFVGKDFMRVKLIWEYCMEGEHIELGLDQGTWQEEGDLLIRSKERQLRASERVDTMRGVKDG